MELTQFASLIASNSSNTAKNALSYLIGNGLNNINWSTALAELYKSYPEQIKTTPEDKKEFLPVILKYFKTYTLTQENISIYQEYENLFSAKHKEDIKNFNPHWTWEKEPEVLFKNVLSFSYAVSRSSRESKFEFLRKYENQLDNFIATQKDKIYKHFSSQNIFKSLMEENYYEFTQFCDKYQFDRIEIVKNNITPYGNLYQKEIFDQPNLNFYLDDLTKLGKDYLKKIDDFYPQSDWQGLKRNCTVYSVIIECLGNFQYKSAMKWMFVFNEELTNYAKLYNINHLNNSLNFKNLLNTQIDMIKQRSSSTSYMEKFFLEKVLKDENWFKFMDTYELFEHLNEKYQPREKIKPKKI